jgi:hypothetical protein
METLDSIKKHPILKDVLDIVYKDEFVKGYKTSSQALEQDISLCHLSIDIRKIPATDLKRGEGFEICVKKMYEFVPMNFKVLKGLGELFGTDQIDVDNWSRSGCQTCDYGSSYEVKFQIYNATKNVVNFE